MQARPTLRSWFRLAACAILAFALWDAALAADRVLVLASREWPVVQQVRAELKAGGRGDPPLPPMEVDLVVVTSGAEAHAAMQRLLPQLGRYRALFTPSQTYARAAQLVAPQLPIIFDGVNVPTNLCLVDSLVRPGRNATGYMHALPRDEEKMLQALQQAFPALREVLLLIHGDLVSPESCSAHDLVWKTARPASCTPGAHALDAYVRQRIQDGLDQAAQRMGLRLRPFVICEPADLALLSAARLAPHVGVLVPWQTLFDEHRRAVIDAVAATRRPAIYPRHQYSRDGGLMSLEVIADLGPDRASVLALLQVLGGRDPAVLPVQSPRGYSFTINAVAAQRSGNFPSLAALRRADTILRQAAAAP